MSEVHHRRNGPGEGLGDCLGSAVHSEGDFLLRRHRPADRDEDSRPGGFDIRGHRERESGDFVLALPLAVTSAADRDLLAVRQVREAGLGSFAEGECCSTQTSVQLRGARRGQNPSARRLATSVGRAVAAQAPLRGSHPRGVVSLRRPAATSQSPIYTVTSKEQM